MSTFELHRALRLASPDLLKELLLRFRITLDIDWLQISPSSIDPLIRAIRALEESQRDKVHVALSQVHELGDERGTQVLHDEVQFHAPDKLAEFEAQSGRFDKALWSLLNVPEQFEVARKCAEAARLSFGRSWARYNGLPKVPATIEPRHLDDLKQSLSDYYWGAEGRGKFCHIDYQVRPSGEHLLFCQLDDYPDASVVFDQEGTMRKQQSRHAFDAVLMLDLKQGVIEMFAKGGRPVHQALRERACSALLGLNVAPADPLKPEYRLNHLLLPGATLKTHPADMIEAVQITRIKVRRNDRRVGSVEIVVNPQEHGNGLSGMHRALEHSLHPSDYAIERLNVLGMTFKLIFTSDAPARNMSFDVNCPNTCNLKSKPDYQRMIGERCTRDWGVAVA